MTKTALRIALVTSLAVLAAAGSAAAAPVPSFTVAPNPPLSGVSATYTSTSTPTTGQNITKVEWDFDNNGVYEETDEAAPWTVAHTYQTAGIKTVGIRVTDDQLLGTPVAATQDVIVATRAPTASFTFSPLEPFVGDEVLFASNSGDPDGDSLDHLWDFGDGVTSPLRNPRHAFSESGSHTVTLKVTDPFGASDTTTSEVVAVQPPLAPGPTRKVPVARFGFGPVSPTVGEPVAFFSGAYDPDGELRSVTWDLDGDGQFDDARGAEVVYTYRTSGPKVVRLRVEDNDQLAAVEQRTVQVDAAPKPPPGFLRPNPNVLFRGVVLPTGLRVLTFSVVAPKKALVTVRCKGRGCGVKQRRKRVQRESVRFKTYERFLRAGVRLEVFVTKPGLVGDYTRYTIRKGKIPKRKPSCVPPKGKLRPVKCSAF